MDTPQSGNRPGAPGRSLLIVNLIGGILVCVFAAVGIWEGLLQPSTVSADLRELRTTLADRTKDLATLEYELGEQEILQQERGETLAAAGAPPAHTPIEDDLRTITGLARDNHLRLAEVTPLAPVSYPGVLELRYRIKGVGRYADLAAMLSRFEACNFWADITYMQMVGSTTRRIPGADNALGAEGMVDREMTLTVSFYSTAKPIAGVGGNATEP